MIQNDAAGLQRNSGNVNVMVRVGCNDELDEPPTGAIDLIGSFNNQPRGTFALSHLSDHEPPTGAIDLIGSFNNQPRGTFALSHLSDRADVLEFYPHLYKNSKSLQSIFPTLADNQAAMKEGDSKPGKHMECNNDTFQPHAVIRKDSRENLPTLVAGQSKLKMPSTQLGLIPVPGVTMHDMDVACKNIIPQVDYGKTEQGYHQKNDEATSCSIHQTVQEQNKRELVGELRCTSPIADQSACSSLCNGTGNDENSSAHGGVSSRSDASAIAFAAAVYKVTTTESFNDINFFSHDGSKGMYILHSSHEKLL
ncbi:hypothetical protein F3Y22_tig00113337pilonHSYRG00063 [Hibiscus syriacus]|uniref:Uncharacterized protein n=1 Tax=Hibiscus syriacus TaxID=106335 RepID=A0A6A2XZQ1_HIBSY|nr:hypothetical protein F3Y22_tig00113337pilonHSYRG00063 [Hibiscus syriacus]